MSKPLKPTPDPAQPHREPGQAKWPWLILLGWSIPVLLVVSYFVVDRHPFHILDQPPAFVDRPDPEPPSQVALFQPALRGTKLVLPVSVAEGPLHLHLAVSDEHGHRLLTSDIGMTKPGDYLRDYDLGDRLIPGAYKVVVTTRNQLGSVRSQRYTFLLERGTQAQTVSRLADSAGGVAISFYGCATDLKPLLKSLKRQHMIANFFCHASELDANPMLAAQIVHYGGTVGLLVQHSCGSTACVAEQTAYLKALNRKLVRRVGISTLPFVAFAQGVKVDPNALQAVGAAGYSYVVTPKALDKKTTGADLTPGDIVQVPWKLEQPLFKVIRTYGFKRRTLSVAFPLTTGVGTTGP